MLCFAVASRLRNDREVKKIKTNYLSWQLLPAFIFFLLTLKYACQPEIFFKLIIY
jgi:hypothetical protein